MAFMTAADHTASALGPRSAPAAWIRRYNGAAGYRGPSARGQRIMNLPNTLTTIRIFLVPLLVVVLLTKFEGEAMLGVRKEIVAAAIFGLASVTDWLDGYLARRRGQITAIGQMMDPIADKLLTSAAFISLVQLNLAPAWMVAVIIGRELAVTGLRSFASTRGRGFPASSLGKIKMASQVTAILLLILGQNGAQPFLLLGQIALWIVLLTALVSAADYYRAFMAAAAVTPPPGAADAVHRDVATRRSRAS
jgi:CDP-diacylglycerol--glycerol-3-phosphate 3-phosphatidyltransferase